MSPESAITHRFIQVNGMQMQGVTNVVGRW
jgi:hypothetical protein